MEQEYGVMRMEEEFDVAGIRRNGIGMGEDKKGRGVSE